MGLVPYNLDSEYYVEESNCQHSVLVTTVQQLPFPYDSNHFTERQQPTENIVSKLCEKYCGLRILPILESVSLENVIYYLVAGKQE